MSSRIFKPSDFILQSETEPIRSVINESADAVVIMWHVLPGQQIKPHIHPEGQDTWIVVSGEGMYICDAESEPVLAKAGHILVAHRLEVHGVINTGSEPFQFISILSPAKAGFQAF